MSNHADRAVERIALAQQGAFTRAQAIAAGHTARTIDRRLRSRAWSRRAQAVYALAAHPAG